MASGRSLSNWELKQALIVRLDFLLLCGSSVLERCPDHATIMESAANQIELAAV